MNLSTIAGRMFALADRLVLRHLPPAVRDGAYRQGFLLKRKLLGGGYQGASSISMIPTSPGIPRNGAVTLPEGIVDEIQAIRRDVDPRFLLSGTPKANRHQTLYPTNPEPGRAYREMVSGCALDSVSHVILVPWLKRGGADLVAIAHANALARLGAKVLVVATLAEDSPWAERLEAGVTFLEFGKRTKHLSEYDRLLVLCRMLVQSSAKVVHVINSNLGWQALSTFGKAVANSRNVFASLYCDDGITPDGRRKGFAHDHLPKAAPHLKGIIFDNPVYASEIAGIYGIPRDRLHVAWAPTERRADVSTLKDGPILWASRIDTQKRLDLLVRIAKVAPDLRFEVHGGSVLERDESALKELRSLANVDMKGPFDGFHSITGSGRHSAYLYTSSWDGLPNVLLEAGMSGLPIVASGVGGIGALLSDETGWIVKESGNPQAYVDALREALADDGMRAASMRRLVLARHTNAEFERMLTQIPGYTQTAKT